MLSGVSRGQSCPGRHQNPTVQKVEQDVGGPASDDHVCVRNVLYYTILDYTILSFYH